MRFFLLSVCFTISILVFAQNDLPHSFQALNSSYDEQNAVLSPDGHSIYYTIANHPQNIGGLKDPGDIWFSIWEDGHWSAPRHTGSLINDRGYNGVAGFSPDGRQMFLLSHYSNARDGAARSQGISVSRNNGVGWSKPENIAIPYFQNKSGIVAGYLSPDNQVFVYSAETYGSYGVEDIYVTLRGSGGWSSPRNLGSTINTSLQELSPSISADGNTLYFSANGRGGFGSFDVYAASRKDDSWQNWTEPVNLGPKVNSAGRELYYRPCPGTGMALYTSTTNSDGYGDIKMYVPDAATPEDLATPLVQESPPQRGEEMATIAEPRQGGVKVFGRITSATTGESVTATVTFSDARGDTNIISDASGYTLYVSPPVSYSVKIEATGYVSALEKLDAGDLAGNSLEMNYSLQPVEKGTTVNLKNVLFEQSRTELLPESFPELDLVVSFLMKNPTVSIELAGHTDNRGVQSDNVKLSQARVEKVKAYLVSQGIDEKRISGKGYGGSRPIASNDKEETRKLNRRVEFTIKRF